MVSAARYGTEEIITERATRADIDPAVPPVLWCLPYCVMIGELSSALPQRGGYYAWGAARWEISGAFRKPVALAGRKYFDMAIYPTLFVFT